MSGAIARITEHLKAQREKGDALSRARKEQAPRPESVIQALTGLRDLVLDRSDPAALESEIQVVHGLVARLIGQRKASALIEALPQIRHCIAMDVEAAFEGDPSAKSYAEVVLSHPSTLAVSTYRIAHTFYEMGEPVIARIMSEEAHGRTGIDIHPGARIGCHFFVDHGTGVVIGESCEIGNRVKIYHGVTLGAFSNKNGRADVGRKRHPTIEDDVTIYPNATILGGETVVGEGAVIGGNAWITASVPPYTTVVKEPRTPQIRPRP